MRIELLLLLSISLALGQPTPDPNAVVPPAANPPTDPPTDPPTPPPPTDPPTPPPPPAVPKLEPVPVDNSAPISKIYGSYELQSANHKQSRPGWASVWEVDKDEPDFGVYFWPPKYCHAIYVCLVDNKQPARFAEFDCDNAYIKYYPHIRKIFFKKDAASAEQAAFYVDPSLQFQNSGAAFVLKALVAEPVDHEDWILMKKIPLINIRMCEINLPGRTFSPIFDERQPDNNGGKNTWPVWLNDGEKHVPTVNLPATGESKKTIDLLAYLKDLEPAATTTLGTIQQYCPNYGKMGVQSDRKPVYEHSVHVSIASYDVYQPIMQPGNSWGLWLEFRMSNCQWIRFWATDKPMSSYKTEMKVEDTLDIFLQEGFFIPPDSDIPIELPDIQMMDRMKLTIIRKPDGATGGADDHELMEFSFGGASDDYVFHQFFKSESFGKKTYTLHMIRSPKCEASIVPTETPFSDDPNAVNQMTNMKDVRSCAFFYLIDPQAVAEENNKGNK
uniref:PKD domain-containing protein n=1 Tax=Caenorhabditis tropicalis TaxID=1561998 RepID=A0A1I7UMI4_9PELO